MCKGVKNAAGGTAAAAAPQPPLLLPPCAALPPSQAFARIIYLSQIVFGDQGAAMHLQWGTHFPVTDAQLFVARRDNAKAIFKQMFDLDEAELKADR